MPKTMGKASMTAAPHATEWNRVARAEAKATKQANQGHERPMTSQRKARLSVGITNRPRSVPLMGLEGTEHTDGSKAESSDRLFDSSHDTIASVQVVNKNQRMFRRSDKVKSSLYHPSPTWPFEPEKSADNRYLKNIRDKIFRKHLNLNPVLRKLASQEGYIACDDLRRALQRLNFLTDAEMEFFTRSRDPDRKDQVHCEELLKSIQFPDYDQGFYDPLGDFRKREIAYLSHVQHSWKEKSQSLGTRSDSASISDQKIHSHRRAQDLQNTLTSSISKYALKKVSDITKRLETGGVPVFQYLKKLDKDGTGIIRRADFDDAIKQYSNPAMVKDLVQDFWVQADHEGSQTLNYLQLQESLNTMEESKIPPVRAQSNMLATTSSLSQYPWTDTRSVRSPCLPSCHYNVRTRGDAPIRNTAEIIIPDEKTFSYCPDWMRSTSVSLKNPWLINGTGQGNIVQTRQAAKIERKKAANARIDELVAQREMQVEYLDAARLNGISRARHDWVAAMQGIWA